MNNTNYEKVLSKAARRNRSRLHKANAELLVRERQDRRRARKKHLRNEAARLRHKVYRAYGGTCYICGEIGASSIDHVIPLIKGGTNDLSNLRLVHEECNKMKGSDIYVLPVELEQAGW